MNRHGEFGRRWNIEAWDSFTALALPLDSLVQSLVYHGLMSTSTLSQQADLTAKQVLEGVHRISEAASGDKKL